MCFSGVGRSVKSVPISISYFQKNNFNIEPKYLIKSICNSHQVPGFYCSYFFLSSIILSLNLNKGLSCFFPTLQFS